MNNKLNILLIGYGSQGAAWCLNLLDGGHNITVGLRSTSTQKIPKQAKVINLEKLNVNQNFDCLLLLIPDSNHCSFLEKYANSIKKNTRIIYAHGASNFEHNLEDMFPKFRHLLLAPKAIASEIRFQYELGGKLGAVYSYQTNKDKIFLQFLAKQIGITAGPYKTSFKEEACADLFSEQSLLCSIIPYGSLASFNYLQKKGVNNNIAFIECWHEVKLIADAMIKYGPIDFFKLISPHAFIGGHKAQKMIFDKRFNSILDSLWNDIESKKFFNEVNKTDINKLKAEVIDAWSKTNLNEKYIELKSDLVNM